VPLNQLTDSEFKQLRDYIEKSCGIALGDEKAYLVQNRLTGLLAEAGCASFDELYRKATADPTLGLRDKIVDAMTTNETSWFRDSYPFDILQRMILKKFADEIVAGKRRHIRIWCAACSTGQEPYGVGIVLQEFSRRIQVLPLARTEIVATDISPSVLFLAAAGRFDTIAMSRGMPSDIRDRYFTCSGRTWIMHDTIRKMVTFKKLNLQDDFSRLGHFDVVFCRNVMIYFSDSFKRHLFSRLSSVLNPGAYLFLGASESAGNYTDKFTSINENKHMYFQFGGETHP
jgi:chemotaxis protein methyltransferase CheR